MSNFKIQKQIKENEKRIEKIRYEIKSLKTELTMLLHFSNELKKFQDIDENKLIIMARENAIKTTQKEYKKCGNY